MKELLREFLTDLLKEATPQQRKFKAVKVTGSEERVTAFSSQKAVDAAVAAGTHRPYLPSDKNLPGDHGTTEPKIGSMRREDPKLTAQKQQVRKDLERVKQGEQPGTVPSPEGVENLNSTSLATQIKDGVKTTGNPFSRYMESVSTFVAKYVIDNPDVSDEDIMMQLTRVDCKSNTLTGQVKSSIPKKSELNQQYQTLKASGVFEAGCDQAYSDAQNQARFMALQAAKIKGGMMGSAIQAAGLTGVSVDTFSGDKQSLQSMRTAVTNANGKIYNAFGQEIPKDAVLKLIDGFGTSKFPADTALIGKDQQGNLVFIGFSDKKDLDAVMNNSTVGAEMEVAVQVVDSLLRSNRIDEAQHASLVQAINDARVDYEKAEDALSKVTGRASKELLDMSSNPEKLTALIRDAKTASTGNNPAAYWDSQVQRFIKSPNKGDNKRFLEQAGWNGTDSVTDELALKAFLHKCAELLQSEEGLAKDDQELLFRLLPSDSKIAIVKQIGIIRNNAIKQLTTLRENLDKVTVIIGDQPVGIGTWIDASIAWKALHLNMTDYDGTLSMVAGEVNVTDEMIATCWAGKKDLATKDTFIKTLKINSKPTVNKEYNITTGQNVEVFTTDASGNPVKVGTREVRSKSGILGKLETTFRFDKDFQNCLSRKGKE